MPIVLRLALLTDLVSVWCEACFPGLAHTGIFSSNHVARLMILLLGAAILLEAVEMAKGMARKYWRIHRALRRARKVAEKK